MQPNIRFIAYVVIALNVNSRLMYCLSLAVSFEKRARVMSSAFCYTNARSKHG
jgi:hypothetical protein